MTTSEHQDADAPVVEITPDPDPEISDDPEQLREQIRQTRAELGETVEALAAKADVKAQLKEKVSASKEQLQEKISTGKDQLQEKISTGKEQLQEILPADKQELQEKLSAGKAQLQEKTAELKGRAGEVSPEQAREVLASVPQRVKTNPRPALLAVGGLLLVWLIRRRRTR